MEKFDQRMSAVSHERAWESSGVLLSQLAWGLSYALDLRLIQQTSLGVVALLVKDKVDRPGRPAADRFRAGGVPSRLTGEIGRASCRERV